MSARPRRSAAQRATMAITDMADRDRDRDRDRDTTDQRTMSSRSSRRSGNGIASVTRGPTSSSPASSAGDGNQHIHLTVKLPSSKLRQATSSTSNGKRKLPGSSVTAAAGGKSGGSAGVSKRTRGGKKSYVIESSEDEEEEEDDEEDEEEEEQEEERELDEIEVYPRPRFADELEEDEDEDEEMGDLGDEDADGDEMDVDAEGDDDDDDEDADGDVDMDVTPAPRAPAIKITKPSKSTATPTKGKSAPVARPVAKGTALAKPVQRLDEDDDDDDEELSELESEPEDVTLDVGHGDEEDAEGDEDEDVDAEGEGDEIEVEVAEEDAEGEEDEELLSDEDGGTPADLSKLTARQRAKLGDASHEYLKLSDEVQAKKHFTAEELSMRRAEMARRRRNLSDKRNEEVKMETINKLLKKQAPKTTRKNALLGAGDDTTDSDGQRADPLFVRWVSSKTGNMVAVPDEVLAGPVGRVFVGGVGRAAGKMVEEVS